MSWLTTKDAKNILKFIIGLVFPLYLVLDKAGLRGFLDKHFDTHADAANWGIIGITVVATVSNYYVSLLNPEKKYEKAQHCRKKFLQYHATRSIDAFAKAEININYNIMIIDKQFKLFDRHAKGWKKLQFYKKTFKCVWTSPDSYTRPYDIVLSEKQGSNSKALDIKGLYMYAISNVPKETVCADLNIDDKQYDSIKDLSLLASIPIRITSDEGKHSKPPIIIGVLTLDSTTEELANIAPDSGFKPTTEEEEEYYKLLNEEITIAITQLSNAYGILYF